MRSASYKVVFYGIEGFMSLRFSRVVPASLEARTAAPALSILLKSSKR
jgi:hypothetical protein